MSEMQYYKDDLKLLRERSKECNNEIINSLLFFISEANSHSTGIADDVEKDIRDVALEFKKNCSCSKR